ncbi:Purine nucleoside phosphorylase 1 [Clostridium bornimense]|uniref:Purine nucleoside phosphorylase n=1 Tax=Clostridium bornimense TaxID=1216932 RepID=W6S2Q8_9CLOT|nr:purine-nucleoside phosphorylase [Clostridium bornimense]CDM68592.1 Purine nucleoside phosphorylase 1 [Clostridium bornimense]
MKSEIIKESVEYIKSKINSTPSIALILGSGLGDIAEEVEDAIYIDYKDVPHMPISKVVGHKGRFVIGKLSGKDVIMMQGRFHYYEGHNPEIIALPIYIMKLLGVNDIVITNAAGGVNTTFNAGDLMIISDQINGAGVNPLIGENNDELGPRFPDMSKIYNDRLIDVTEKCGKKLNLELKKGVYYMTSGPCYETPAEIKMIRILGGDAVGMSTAPEAMVANYCGMNILGISCITNMAAGVLNQPLNHEEVIETSNNVKKDFIALIKEIIKEV